MASESDSKKVETKAAKALKAVIRRGDVAAFKRGLEAMDEDGGEDLFDDFGPLIIAEGNEEMLMVLNEYDMPFENFSYLLQEAIRQRKTKMVAVIADKMIKPNDCEMRLAFEIGDLSIIRQLLNFESECDGFDEIFTSGHSLNKRQLIWEKLRDCEYAEEDDLIETAAKNQDEQILMWVCETRGKAQRATVMKFAVLYEVPIDDLIIKGCKLAVEKRALRVIALTTAIAHQKADITSTYLKYSENRDKTYIGASQAGMVMILREMSAPTWPTVATLTQALKVSLAHHGVVSYLIAKGARVRADLLLPAVQTKNTKTVRFLLKILGENENARGDTQWSKEAAAAVQGDDLKTAEVLVEADKKCMSSPDLIVIASKNRSMPMIDFLSKYIPNAYNLALQNRVDYHDSETAEDLAMKASLSQVRKCLNSEATKKNDRMHGTLNNALTERTLSSKK